MSQARAAVQGGVAKRALFKKDIEQQVLTVDEPPVHVTSLPTQWFLLSIHPRELWLRRPSLDTATHLRGSQ